MNCLALFLPERAAQISRNSKRKGTNPVTTKLLKGKWNRSVLGMKELPYHQKKTRLESMEQRASKPFVTIPIPATSCANPQQAALRRDRPNTRGEMDRFYVWASSFFPSCRIRYLSTTNYEMNPNSLNLFRVYSIP